MHRDQHRHAAARGVGRAHGVSRRLRRHHPDVQIGARLDEAVVDVEAVREGERRALLDVRFHILFVNLRVVLIGQQDHDDVRALDRGRQLGDFDAALLRLVPRGAALAQRDGDVDPGLLKVERVGVALRAVADDRDLLALDERKVRVLVVIDLHGFPLESTRYAERGCRGRCRWFRSLPSR